MNHDLKWCTANNSIIFLFVLFWAYGHYMIDSYLNEPRFKVMQRPMTKMNAFLRGVSPAVCRNLQFWNIAFSFNFDIYIFNWLYPSAVPSGTFRGFIPGYIHSCCQKASISQSCNVSKEPTSEVYPAMFILKYFCSVPSHVYTRIQVRAHFFPYFQRRPGAVAAILAVCRRPGNRRIHYARLRFVYWQERLFPQCFGAFSISSFPFHFVPCENNL